MMVLVIINMVACAGLTACANREYRPWSLDDIEDMFSVFMKMSMINNGIILVVYVVYKILLVTLWALV